MRRIGVTQLKSLEHAWKIYFLASSGGLFNREDLTLCRYISIQERKRFYSFKGGKGQLHFLRRCYRESILYFPWTCYIYSCCISCKKTDVSASFTVLKANLPYSCGTCRETLKAVVPEDCTVGWDVEPQMGRDCIWAQMRKRLLERIP